MNHTKYEERKATKTATYVAEQVAHLNQKIKEQQQMIKNLKAAIVDKGKIIGTLNHEIETLRLRATTKNIES